jgi:hypothetical protein
MNAATRENTLFIAAASFGSDSFRAVHQFALSARVQGIPVHYVSWRAVFRNFLADKLLNIRRNLQQWEQRGIRHLIYTDCSDVVFLAERDAVIERYNEAMGGNDTLIACADHFSPYILGLVGSSANPWWQAAGVRSSDKTRHDFCCLGSVAGGIRKWRLFIDLVFRIHDDFYGNRSQFSFWADMPDKEQITAAFDSDCDQLHAHLVRKFDPSLIIPDTNKILFSNFKTENRDITLDQMRQPNRDPWATIGGALIVHCSQFKRANKLEDWFQRTYLTNAE